jgi:hypothetical protein
MSKRNTETLFLRVDPEVARMVRRESEGRQVGISQLAEAALRHYLAETTGEEDRKNFLGSVEEALVKRLEGRVKEFLNRIGDLYAREAFDHAEALFLVKALVSMEARDEKVTERLLTHARKDATARLKQRVEVDVEGLAQARSQVERLSAELARMKQEVAAQTGRAERAEQQLAAMEEKVGTLNKQLRQQKHMQQYERDRDEWAGQQMENQGMLRRKTFQEWRVEYQWQHHQSAEVDA